MFLDPPYLLEFFLDRVVSSRLLSPTTGLLIASTPPLLKVFREHMAHKRQMKALRLAHKCRMEILRFHATHPSVNSESWDVTGLNTETFRSAELESASKLPLLKGVCSSIRRLVFPIITLAVVSIWVIYKVEQLRADIHPVWTPFEQNMILFIVSYWFCRSSYLDTGVDLTEA